MDRPVAYTNTSSSARSAWTVVLTTEGKEFMRGRKFADDEDVICTANGWLKKIFFCNRIRALERISTE